MKKFLVILLIAVLLLAGCGKKEAPAKEEEKPVATEESKEEKTPEKSEEETGEKPLKVILLIPGTLGDKSFFDAANAGLEMIKKDLGAETKVVEMGTDPTKWEPNFLEASEGDWDIIISGNDTTEIMNTTAAKFPEKRYINFDTFIQETPENVYAMFYSTNELSFLAGALAGMVTKSDMPSANKENVIGFLGGMDIPGINDFLVGYIEGALYVNPDVKVFISYAGDFTDPAKGKELALVQFQSGVDISFAAAGGTGIGLLSAASEKGVYAIGVDSDQAELFKEKDPEMAKAILTSAVKRIDVSIFNAVKAHMEGTIQYGTYNQMGVKEGGVGLAKNEFYEVVPQEVKEKITEIEEKIASGEIKVGTAFGISTEELDEIRNSVKP